MTDVLFPVERYGPVGAALQQRIVGDFVPSDEDQARIRQAVGEILAHSQIDRLEEKYQGEEGVNRYVDEVLMHWVFDAWKAVYWMVNQRDRGL